MADSDGPFMNPTVYPQAIEGHTRNFPSQQSNHDSLDVRDETLDDGSNIMVTEWKFSQEQLDYLAKGNRLYVGVTGDKPIGMVMTVGPPSADTV